MQSDQIGRIFAIWPLFFSGSITQEPEFMSYFYPRKKQIVFFY
jgi:hypothetical protein